MYCPINSSSASVFEDATYWNGWWFMTSMLHMYLIAPWTIIIKFPLPHSVILFHKLRCLRVSQFIWLHNYESQRITKGLLYKVSIKEIYKEIIISLFCRFSIDRHTDLERQFNINADDGKITLATPLDRELSVWHNITIIATEISKCLGLSPIWGNIFIW